MVPSVGLVKGELLRWARMQQGLTMRDVQARAGITPAYQSEVERGHKREVSAKSLQGWLDCLQVTEPFVRGEVPRYAVEPGACKGLAADVGAALRSEGADWSSLSALERQRKLFGLIASQSRRLPRVVLAYLFHLDVVVLDRIIAGDIPPGPQLQSGVAAVADVPESFLQTGRWGDEGLEAVIQQLLPAIRFALQFEFTAQDLKELILTSAYMRALHSSRSGGATESREMPGTLLDILSERLS